MELKGKNAIVTGGAMGIGLATCKRLAGEGCNITIWDINEVEMRNAHNVLTQLGVKVFVHYCDVSDKSRIEELTTLAMQEMGSIDILINNAGYVKKGELLDQDLEVWEKTIQINLTSILYTINSVLPHMYNNNFGHIVNISSAAGLLGVGGLSVYAATKWAVWGLTESMRFEAWNKNKNVKWTSIHPSYLAHGMFEGAKLNFFGNLLVPLVKNHDVIAKAIVNDALKKGKYVVRRPFTLRLTILFRGILPDYLFQKMLVLLGVQSSMKSFKGRG